MKVIFNKKKSEDDSGFLLLEIIIYNNFNYIDEKYYYNLIWKYLYL